jgi:hypothetical protein
MAQQSILGRIGQLARANINAMLDAAEDPEKMLDQMVRDYTTNIAEAEDAVAQTIGNLRMLEEDHQEALENAREWGVKALAASRKGDELRASGDTGELTASTPWPRSRCSASSTPRARSTRSSPRSPHRPRSSSGSRRAWSECAASSRS